MPPSTSRLATRLAPQRSPRPSREQPWRPRHGRRLHPWPSFPSRRPAPRYKQRWQPEVGVERRPLAQRPAYERQMCEFILRRRLQDVFLLAGDVSRRHRGGVVIFGEYSPSHYPIRNSWWQDPHCVPSLQRRQTPLLHTRTRLPRPREPGIHRAWYTQSGDGGTRPIASIARVLLVAENNHTSSSIAGGHREYRPYATFVCLRLSSIQLPCQPYATYQVLQRRGE